MVLIIGGMGSISLIVTNVYFKTIADKINCIDNNATEFKQEFTLAAIVTSRLLHLLSFLLFARDILGLFTRRHYNKLQFKKKCTRICFWLSIIPLAGVLSYLKNGISILHGNLEQSYIKFCYFDTQYFDRLLRAYIISNFSGLFSDFSMIVLCIYSVKILHTSLCNWKEATKNMKIGEWRPGHEDLCETIEEKLNCLYYNYIKIGRKISLECNVLRRWFVVMFSQCFLLVLVSVLNLRGTLSRWKDTEEKYDFNYLKFFVVADILVYFFIFFLPYYMGSIVNKAHQNYHKKIIDTYLGIEIVIDGCKYVCIPGKPLTEELVLNLPLQNEALERPLLQHTATEIEMSTEQGGEVQRAELTDEKYREYFKEALRVHKGLIMAKKTEFDFIPSFIISVPLGSFLYTFTAVSSILSVVFISLFE